MTTEEKEILLATIDEMINEQVEELRSKRLTGCGLGAVSLSVVKLRQLKTRIIRKFELENIRDCKQKKITALPII